MYVSPDGLQEDFDRGRLSLKSSRWWGRCRRMEIRTCLESCCLGFKLVVSPWRETMRISHQLLFILLVSVVLQLGFLIKYLFPSSLSKIVTADPSLLAFAAASSCSKWRTVEITNNTNYSITNDLADLIRLPKLPPGNVTTMPAPSSPSVCAFPSAHSKRRHPILGSYYTWIEYYYEHFPHFMEYLYPCWSYWMTQSSSDKVLILPTNWATDRKRILRQSPYIEGILQVLEHEGVRILSDSGRDNVLSSLAAVPIAVGCRLARIEDSHAFRSAVMDSIGLDGRHLHRQHCKLDLQPKIGILDRSTTRRLVNVREIQQTLHTEQRQASNSSASLTPPTIAYFEHMSFFDQMEWLSQRVDILVAPHGAGLTSIPLLPACAGLVEIFPTGYDYRHFFGALAATSLQQRHRILYSSTGVSGFANETKHAMQTASRRRKARSVPVCPDTAMVSQSVQELVEEWRKCICMTGASS